MVKEEFKENQPFRYPEEYDVYKQSDEKPMKLLPQEKGKRGLRQPDYDAGARSLEAFKRRDGQADTEARATQVVERRTALAFERAMIAEAKIYLKRRWAETGKPGE